MKIIRRKAKVEINDRAVYAGVGTVLQLINGTTSESDLWGHLSVRIGEAAGTHTAKKKQKRQEERNGEERRERGVKRRWEHLRYLNVTV